MLHKALVEFCRRERGLELLSSLIDVLRFIISPRGDIHYAGALPAEAARHVRIFQAERPAPSIAISI